MAKGTNRTSPELLRRQIQDLTEAVGPDNHQVKRLKADLNRRLATTVTAAYPKSTLSAAELNALTSAAREQLATEQTKAAADEFSKRSDTANMLMEIDKILPTISIRKTI